MQDRLLLVDDDASLLKLLTIRLKAEGFSILSAASADEALQVLRNKPVDLVLTDLRMEGASGLDLFTQIRHFYPGLPVIIMSAQGTIPEAVSATQMGVFEFLTKPVDKKKLLKTIRAALEQSGATQAEIFEEWREHVVTRSPLMERILNQVRQVASSEVSVLITGDSGSGKELLARALHEADKLRSGPMVAINCGALPEQLLESELFGHVKGAFTGAVNEHQGLFRAAHGGTLFLDEIGDMPMPVQVKLLRVLQERRVRPVGSTSSEAVDVRIISATNRDLERDMREGLFREDLFYRLNVVNFHLPSLAERREDIPLLTSHFIEMFHQTQGLPLRNFSPDAIAFMQTMAWPGNVRQLRNLIERLLILGEGTGPIEARELPSEEEKETGDGRIVLSSALATLPLREAREAFEREYLLTQINRFGGNISRTANFVGMERSALHRKLKSLSVVTGNKSGARVAYLDEEDSEAAEG